MTGYIKLHRGLLDWEWYGDTNCFRLFTHCLLKANYENKNWKGRLIKRGQLVTGRKELSLSTGLTEQQIRTAIKKLKSTNEITVEATNEYSIVTVVNYSKYQNMSADSNQQITTKTTNEQPTDNQQITTKTTNEQPTDNQQITTTKENKEVLKENNNSDELLKKKDPEVVLGKRDISALFDEFWGVYKPVECDGRVVNKGSKLKSLEKFTKLIKSGYDFDLLIEKTKQYLNSCNANNQLTQSVPVFFNRRTFDDDFVVDVFTPEQRKYTPSYTQKKIEITEDELSACREARQQSWSYKFIFKKSEQGLILNKAGKLFEPTEQEIEAINAFFAARKLKFLITGGNNPDWVNIEGNTP